MIEQEKNRALAQQFMDALSNWDSETLMAITHPDFQLKIPSNCGLPPSSSRELLMPILSVFKEVTPGGITFHIKHITAEEDRVCIAADGESTMYNGKPYNNQYHILFRMKDNKVIEYVEYMDSHLVVTTLIPEFKNFGLSFD